MSRDLGDVYGCGLDLIPLGRQRIVMPGHGIHNAVRSGLLAGAAATRALDDGDRRAVGAALAGYERAWREALGDELRYGRWLQRLHARPWLIEGLMRRIDRRPSSRDRFMGLVGHAVPKAEVWRPGFLRQLLV